MPLRPAESTTTEKPVHIHTATPTSEKLLSCSGEGSEPGPADVSQAQGVPPSCSQAVPRPPNSVTAALTVPMSGLKSNMKRQITDAATNDIAIGTKIADLACDAQRTREASRAMASPSTTTPNG